MRAVVLRRRGGPEVLEVAERDVPRPGPGELLVDVAAAGVNFADIYQREGEAGYAGELPLVPGVEGAGTVAATGAGVSGAGEGDRVAWADVPGSYAETVVVPAERAVPVPGGVDLGTAAAALLQGMTAHYLTASTCPVAPGDAVVVHAAAGGVGLLLTQMAAMRGGVVVATASTPEKRRRAREAGAEHVTGYGDVVGVVRDVTAGEGAAAVYDGVGAPTFEASLEALRPRGTLALYGSAGGRVPPFDLMRLSHRSLVITRPRLRHFVATREELLRRAGDVLGWVAGGRLQVAIGGTYPLEAAARAQAALGARRTTGKLLLLP